MSAAISQLSGFTSVRRQHHHHLHCHPPSIHLRPTAISYFTSNPNPISKATPLSDRSGGFILAGGLITFILSRNPTTLINGFLFGGSLLALNMTSLKFWRKGKLCLPFILGQAAVAGALCWKNFKAYLLTKQLFPSVVYASLSAAMLCFYSYVVIAGGNPPPKKLQSRAN